VLVTHRLRGYDLQLRAEFLDAVLVVLCVLLPDIEERLRQALPGQGRQQVAGSIQGASQAFYLAETLSDTSKQV